MAILRDVIDANGSLRSSMRVYLYLLLDGQRDGLFVVVDVVSVFMMFVGGIKNKKRKHTVRL